MVEDKKEFKKLTQASKFFVVAVFVFFYWVWGQEALAITNQINYQGKLTNASGVTVSDGSYDIKIVIYDSATGGACQYTLRGTCGSPTAASTTVTNGIFSINLGDTSASHNAVSSTLFNSTTTLFLGVTVNTDSEMTPRKRITAAPYAFTSLNLGGASSTIFVGTSTLPSGIKAYLESTTASDKLLVIRGNSSQSGHLMDLQNSSGASLAYITSGGSVRTSSTLLVTGDTTFYATSSVRQLNTVRYADQYCATPGTLDDTCVQNAINDCPANGCEVFVPAGTYNFSSGNVVLKSGVKVHGAGKANTIINITVGHTGVPFSSTAFRATGTVNVATTIAGVYATTTTKTRRVTVASPSGFSASDTVWLQDAITTTSSAKQQMTTIESISGNIFTLKDTLLFNFATDTVFQKVTPVRNIAISDLTIQTSQTSPRFGILFAIIDTAAIERVKFNSVLTGIAVLSSGVSNTTPNTNVLIQDNDFDDLVPIPTDVSRAIYSFGNNFRILRNRIRGIVSKGMELDSLAYSLIAHNQLLGDATTTANSFGITINDSMVRSSITNNTFTNLTFALHGFNDVNNNPIAVQDSNISNNIFTNSSDIDSHIVMTATVDFQRNVISGNTIKGGAANGIALFACTAKDNIIEGNSILVAGGTPINMNQHGTACASVTGVTTITTSGNFVAHNNVDGSVTALTGTGDKVMNNPKITDDFITSKLSIPSGSTGYIFDTASSTPVTTSTILMSFRNAGVEKLRIDAGGGLRALSQLSASSTLQATGATLLYGSLQINGATTSSGRLIIGDATSSPAIAGDVLIKRVGSDNGNITFSNMVNGPSLSGSSGSGATVGLEFYTAGTRRFMINSLGGLATGNADPGSTAGDFLVSRGSGAGLGVLNFDSDTSPAGVSGVAGASGFLSFTTNGSERTRINASGHFMPLSNNAIDLGGFASGFVSNAFRDIYASGTLRLSGGAGANGGLQISASAATTTLTSLATSTAAGFGVGAFVLDTQWSLPVSSSSILLSVRNAGTRVFSIATDGGVRSTGTFVSNGTGVGDLAEFVDLTPGEVVEAGDVLVIDSTSLNKFKKSALANSEEVAGVISNSAKFIMGAEGAGRAALALAGLVKVKVTAANGAIKVGDYLVTSDKPGTAMRYDSSSSTTAGFIGQALEPLAEGDGQITILINRSLAPAKTVLEPAALRTQLSADGQLVVNKDLDFNGYAILNIKSISSADNKWRIDEEGNLIMVIKTSHGDKELYTLQNVNAKEVLLSGIGTLNNGRAEIIFEPIDQEIIDGAVPLKVTVTLREPAKGLYVSTSSARGFVVEELDGGASNASFSWLAIAKRRDTISLNEAQDLPPATSNSSSTVGELSSGSGQIQDDGLNITLTNSGTASSTLAVNEESASSTPAAESLPPVASPTSL